MKFGNNRVVLMRKGPGRHAFGNINAWKNHAREKLNPSSSLTAAPLAQQVDVLPVLPGDPRQVQAPNERKARGYGASVNFVRLLICTR